MDLGETGIGKERAFFIGAIRRRDIAPARVGRQIKDISIAPGGQHDRVAGKATDLSGAEISRDNTFGMPVHHNEIEHLGLREHLHSAGRHLAAERLVTAEQQLLSGLTPRIKRS